MLEWSGKQISKRISNTSGRRREILLNQNYHFYVHLGEAESFEEIVSELESSRQTVVEKEQQITTLLEEMATVLSSKPRA